MLILLRTLKAMLSRLVARRHDSDSLFYINGPEQLPPPLSREQENQFIAELPDEAARNALIEHNLRLVAHIIKKYYSAVRDQDDLISIGTIGLIKAVDTFDHTKGVRLATYASRCVENEILMHFRAQKKSAQDVSLSDYIETGADGTALSLMDVVAEDADLLETVSRRESVRTLCRAVKEELTEQEKMVIELRYGLFGGPPMRQREVAQVTGLSRSYISRIEKRALQKLKQELVE